MPKNKDATYTTDNVSVNSAKSFCQSQNNTAKKNRHAVHFSSNTVEWFTPLDFFERMNALYGPFQLDPCCTKENAKCARYFTKEDNGLIQPWAPYRVWLNPPYGREISLWMRKAYEESQRGAFVVCLVPSRTDTAWWHDWAMRGQIRYVQGRLKFGGSKTSAPFPSAVVIFRPYSKGVKQQHLLAVQSHYETAHTLKKAA